MQQIPLDLPAAGSYRLHDWQQLRWQKGVRYYRAEFQQDLWGDWILVRRWGRRGDKTGRVLNLCCESYQHGAKTLARTIRRRRQGGYQAL